MEAYLDGGRVLVAIERREIVKMIVGIENKGERIWKKSRENNRNENRGRKVNQMPA